jgi:uncharacterized protein
MLTLIDAIKAGDAPAVRRAIESDPRAAATADAQGLTPLMCSLYYAKRDVTPLLLEAGAPVNIFEACALGDSDRVRAMIELSPELVSRYSIDGWTPLHLAAYFGNVTVATYLLERGARIESRSTNAQQNTPLHAAAAGRQMDAVALLLDSGADVNARQHGGFTPLMSAAANGDLPMAILLLGRGADRGARAGNNQTALDLALSRGHQAVVELLEA